MTDLGRNGYDGRLEHELRDAAPQARALFVDELARRVRVQRSRLRPGRARMGFALGFSAMMIAVLGVLGAPGLVAHAATAIADTATSVVNGGGSANVTASGTTTSATASATDQYAVSNGICQRLTGNGNWQLVFVTASDLDAHAVRGDIIPAPPWGCPPAAQRGTKPTATTTTVGGPASVKILQPTTFLVQLRSADGSVPHGTVSCFDNLQRVVNGAPVDATGSASCAMTFSSLGTHSVTAVFKTNDVNKWASSAANVTSINVVKATVTISVVTSATPAPLGAGVTFTARVDTGGSGTAAGSVEFWDGGTSLGIASVGSGGSASLTTTALAAGSHTIRAAYSGDNVYAAGAASVPQTITAPAAAPQPEQQQQPAVTTTIAQQQTQPPAQTPPSSLTTTVQPATAGSVALAPVTGAAAPTTVAWRASTFGSAPVHVSATVEPPVQAQGVQFAAGSAVIEIGAVTDSGQAVTALSDVLDIAMPNAPADVAPMYQRGSSPWVVIPRLGGTTLPAAQPDGWYVDGTTLHILTRHLTKFGLAKALAVKWGTRRRVHLRWAQRIVVYGAPSIDAQATYTLRRGKTVYGRWTRTLPAGKGAPANLWLTGKHLEPGLYKLTILVKAGPQHWTQVVAIRYL
jgi:Bacterial Ig-like domain (group 3)